MNFPLFMTGAAAAALLLTGSTVLAGGTYDLSWYAIDGGGGAFALTGTIGQTDAGTMSGGNFEFNGGFWAGGSGSTLICLGDIVSSATFQPPPDGIVDSADLAFLLGACGANPGSAADIVTSATFQPPPDGVVDGADLAVLLGAWGACK